jgi:hypothetical protein
MHVHVRDSEIPCDIPNGVDSFSKTAAVHQAELTSERGMHVEHMQ